ncbi:uncharacterized protein [Ranitomeya imitator]|uniref:uncharacterized protein n=1 Tax=Ranitomeya imitator TaxID=111125 RepID=UPI0037E7C554
MNPKPGIVFVDSGTGTEVTGPEQIPEIKRPPGAWAIPLEVIFYLQQRASQTPYPKGVQAPLWYLCGPPGLEGVGRRRRNTTGITANISTYSFGNSLWSNHGIRNLVLRVLHNRSHLLGNSDQTDQQTLQDLIQLLQENEPDKGTTDECCQFIDFLNTNIHNIFLTHSMSSSTVTFLDLQDILENGSIVTKLFRKPTATNSLLDYRSFHPVHTRMGVPTGQFLRVRRNCTDDSDFQREARELTTRFKNRHYPRGSISRAYQRASAHTQDSLLEPRTRVLYRTYLGGSTWNLLWRNMPMLIWD